MMAVDGTFVSRTTYNLENMVTLCYFRILPTKLFLHLQI
ncbi:hypothetical protein SRABI64_06171 [Pseudomonas carnis]|nr:hypothetical protein SRABI64_06171 [Pseudomonas carnis]